MFSSDHRITRCRFHSIIAIACLALVASAGRASAIDREEVPASEVLMKACSDELARTATLHLADLDKPYFAQLIVDDNLTIRINAEYGAMVQSNRNRSRTFATDVRVGDYKLDNSNFGGGGGPAAGGRRGRGGGGGAARARGGPLPIDDEPLAIRQSLWASSDADYKEAVEALARKRAYMKDKELTDRPDDFTKVEPVTVTEPAASMAFDRAAWEKNVQSLSGRFKRYPRISESNVQLVARLSNTYLLTTEGTRLRKAETGVVLNIRAEGQADDGMRFADGLSYAAPSPAELPDVEHIAADIDKLANDLSTAMSAKPLDDYTGPVLLDGQAAARAFRSLLVSGVVGRAEPLGTQRRSMAGIEGFERQFGQAVMPKSFRVYDDPTIAKVGDTPLMGHYRFDDEGVPAKRVDIVVDGVLKDMCMSRTPTRKLSGSNGHGRQLAGGAARPSIGNLFIEDAKGRSDADLKQKLIDAAQDAGLDYGIRIASIRANGVGGMGGPAGAMMQRAMRRMGGGGRGGAGLGDPVLVYKVFVSDGHEEPVRGCEFGEVAARSLRKILAAGKTPHVQNFSEGATTGASIIAPAVLFAEVELTQIDQENEMRPILKAPSARAQESAKGTDAGDKAG